MKKYIVVFYFLLSVAFRLWHISHKNDMWANILYILPALNCTCPQGQCSSQACLHCSCIVHCITYSLPWMMLKGWERHIQPLYRSVLQCTLGFTRWEGPQRYFSSHWILFLLTRKSYWIDSVQFHPCLYARDFSFQIEFSRWPRSHPTSQGVWVLLDIENEACLDRLSYMAIEKIWSSDWHPTVGQSRGNKPLPSGYFFSFNLHHLPTVDNKIAP